MLAERNVRDLLQRINAPKGNTFATSDDHHHCDSYDHDNGDHHDDDKEGYDHYDHDDNVGQMGILGMIMIMSYYYYQ